MASDLHAPPSSRMVHIGRQPILDTDARLTGYELLFRGGPTATESRVGTDEQEADRATTSTILTAFSGFSAAELLGGRPGFVNLTRAFLVGELPVPFDADQAVLEVLETVAIDRQVVDGVRRLHENGYRIALDDFVWTESADALLEIAEIVKVDVLTPWEEVLRTLASCRARGRPDLVFLAERVEDEAMRGRCLDHGFTLFQGYHLGRPQTLTTDTISPDRIVAVQLLARLSAPNIAMREIETVLRTDPGLVLQLLRLANASTHGLNRTITSITDAVVLLGLNRLRSWMVLLALSGLGQAADASSVLVRGRTCELLARRIETADIDPDAAFTTGLVDGIAEVIGHSPAQMLDSLPALAPPIRRALAGQDTPLRRLLDAVRHYDREQAEGALGAADDADVAECYLAALAWTTQSLSAA